MTSRTRLVLGLLADDLTGQILELCSGTPCSERELVGSSRAARPTVAQHVAELEALGLLVRQTPREGTTGRPITRWEAAATQVVAAFARAADAFALALLETQVEDQRAAIDERRSRDVQPSPSEAPPTGRHNEATPPPAVDRTA